MALKSEDMKLLLTGYIAIVVLAPTLALSQFGGQHLVLVGYHYPPYDLLIRRADGNYTMKGSNFNIASWVALRLNTTYSILPVNDLQEIAKLGYYEAAFSKLITKEGDVLVSCYAVDPSRAERMDYTSGLAWTEPYTLVVPKPEFENRLFAFIRPFQPMVWLFLLISIIVMILMMTLFSWIYKRYLQPVVVEKCNENDPAKENETTNPATAREGFSYYFIYVMNIMTNHGDYSPYVKHSFRMLTGGLFLASLVLVNLYSSIVMSSLTVPIRNPAVNSLQDLVDNKDVSLIIQKNVILGILILKAESGLYKTLGDQLRRHPDRMLMDYPSAVKYLETGKYAYPWLSSFSRIIVANQYKKDGKCRLQVSDPIDVAIGSFRGLALLQKGSKYREAWSQALIQLWETGLNRFWTNELIPNADACFDKKLPKAASGKSAIKLVDLTSAFLILGIGFGLGTICFISEILHKRLRRRFRG